jgi:aldehyde:ferredoxin oxidoreductase
MDSGWATGDVPVKNWRDGIWKEGTVKLGGFRMAQTILKGQDACLGCPIRCARHIVIDKGPFKMDGPGPEYETLAMLGTLLMNDNLESVCWANDLCNRYGIDTISTGSAIGFAMEAYEKGLITKSDAGGLDLSWGNVDTILELIKLIGEQRGIGALLGQGVKRAAEKIGNGAEAFAVHVKGMEVPAHDPRAFFSMAPNYATSPRGACHLHGNPLIFELGGIMPDAGITFKQGRFDRNGKGLAAKAAQDFASISNSMVVCSMAAMTMQPSIIAGFLSMACGKPYTSQDILRAGERITNLQRLFNLKCGMTGADDKLPKRLLEPTKEGGQAGKVPDIAHQLKEYYKVRGWTAEGVPTAEKIKELGLEFAVSGSGTR